MTAKRKKLSARDKLDLLTAAREAVRDHPGNFGLTSKASPYERDLEARAQAERWEREILQARR